MIPDKCRKCAKRSRCDNLDDLDAMLLCEDMKPEKDRKEHEKRFNNPSIRSTPYKLRDWVV